MNNYPPRPADYYMDLSEIVTLSNEIINMLNSIDKCSYSISKAEELSTGAMEIDNLSIKEPINSLNDQILATGNNSINAVESLKQEAIDLYNQLNQEYIAYQHEQALKTRAKEEKKDEFDKL